MKIGPVRFGLLLAIALAIYFAPSIVGGKVFLPLDLIWQVPPNSPPPGVSGVHNFLIGDMLYENFIWKHHFREAIDGGELPMWNPYAFCGHPLYATGQASNFYPLNLIFLLIPLTHAFVVFTALHLWLGGMFQYLFLRRIGVPELGCAVGGLVFAFCGFFAMRLIWPMLLGSAIWLPLMLLCLIRIAESANARQHARRIAFAALVFAMPLLSGFFEIAFYALFTAGLFTLALGWHIARQRRAIRPSIGFAVETLAVVGLALLLAAPQLLPFREVTQRNTRVGEADYDRMVGRALKAEHLIPMVVPDFFGHPAKHKVWDLRTRQFMRVKAKHGWDVYHYGTKNYSENGYYLGLLPLALALLSLRTPGHHRFFFYLLLLIAMLMAFGTPLYAVFWHVVPGFDQVRTPFRWMFPATFAIASLAAMGTGFWQQRLGGPRNRLIAAALVLGPLLLLGGLVFLQWRLEIAHDLADQAFRGYRQFTEGLFGFLNAWDLAGFLWANALRFAVFLLLSSLVFAMPYMRTWTRQGKILAGGVCLLLVGADAGLANRPFMTHSDPDWLDVKASSIDYLQADDGHFRIGRFKPGFVLHPNLPALYGLFDVGGYDSIILGEYARYLGAIEPQKRLWWNQIVDFEDPASLDSPLFHLLNIRYLLVELKGDIEHPDWEKVYEGGMKIYRCRQDRPRAFLARRLRYAESLDQALARLADPEVSPYAEPVLDGPEGVFPQLGTSLSGESGRDEVQITAYGYNSVELAAKSPVATVAVLCDVIYPGWRVYVDGRRADILRVNGIFRGVYLPPGEHHVAFRFNPDSFRTGVLACLAGLVAMAVSVAATGFADPGRGRRDERPQPVAR